MRPTVAGISISHPDRLLYPGTQITKLALAEYYKRMGRWMLPHVQGRPLTLVRCPGGLKDGCFYMKHSKVWALPAVRRIRIQEKTKIGEYLIVDSVAALISLVQMNILEIHTWNTCEDHLERKILIDYLRNNRTNTSVAAYSTRAKAGAPVSMPLRWKDLTSTLDPQSFTVLSVEARLRNRKDPWADYWRTRQRLG